MNEIRFFLAVTVCAVCARGAVDVRELAAAGGAGGFTEMGAAQTGIVFSNIVKRETAEATATLITPGLAAGDMDGDGLVDLYFCRTDGPNVLYRNLGGWKFEDVTARAGVACDDRQSIGAVFADTDGDGDLDLLVTARGGPNSLFVNDGKGMFNEDEIFPGRLSRLGSTSAALSDVDGDGDLDLYVCNYSTRGYSDDHRVTDPDPKRDENMRRMRAGQKADAEFEAQQYVYNGGIFTRGQEDVFFLNDGRGTFSAAGAERFAKPAVPPGALDGMGLCAQFRDFNQDGAPDLYVCNDFHTPDRVWTNDGRGFFAQLPPNAVRHFSYYAMAVDFADVELDGDLDFFVADMLSRDHARRKRQMGAMKADTPEMNQYGFQPQVMQNTFFLNRGDTTFAEVSAFAGIKASEWTWGALFSDADLDGFADLLTASGILNDSMDADASAKFYDPALPMAEAKKLRASYPPVKSRNLVFRNRGDGTFEEVGQALGLKREEISSGIIAADLDGDGDEDIVISNTDAPAEVYRNDSPAPRIAVRLRGAGANTAAVGARVRLIGAKTQMREVIAGGRYASGGDYALNFATPAAWGPFTLEINWRDERRTVVRDVKAGNRYEVTQDADAVAVRPRAAAVRATMFRDASGELNHKHGEDAFDDFACQPLLPNTLGRLGPGAGFMDLNGDGFDDIVVGASRSNSIAIFEGDGKGKFQQTFGTGETLIMGMDATTVLPLPMRGAGTVLLAGLSQLELPGSGAGGALLARANGTWKMARQIEAPGDTAIGPMAMGDVDGNGTLDVFFGGRSVPCKYPLAADSFLLLTDVPPGAPNGWSAALQKLGMVSGALFADFNGDGRADLAVACEWGPVKILINTGTNFTDASAVWGTAEMSGWWNSVQAGDFNNDGRIDLVAGNWGENSKYGRTPKAGRPLEIYHGDFDGNGTWDVVEAHVDKFTQKLVPERGLSCSSSAMPFVKKATPTYRDFGEAGLTDIYGDRLRKGQVVRCTELRHMVLLNRGDKFEAAPLPVEAQLAPVFGIGVADFDGDGNQDVFLAQNFFATQIEAPRNDAGRGLLLRGDGAGGFAPLDARDSGIEIYGEQRACAVADYNGDGRTDLLATQNNSWTRLFQNVTGTPGLRVKLTGTPGNPAASGAIIRPLPESGSAPATVVTTGAGYWSVDSSARVVTSPQPFTKIEIRWPGGAKQIADVPPGVREITVTQTK